MTELFSVNRMSGILLRAFMLADVRGKDNFITVRGGILH
jgi:hypothetical protein